MIVLFIEWANVNCNKTSFKQVFKAKGQDCFKVKPKDKIVSKSKDKTENCFKVKAVGQNCYPLNFEPHNEGA